MFKELVKPIEFLLFDNAETFVDVGDTFFLLLKLVAEVDECSRRFELSQECLAEGVLVLPASESLHTVGGVRVAH